MRIIAVCGGKGHGKSTIGKHMPGFVQMGFADSLKDVVALLYGYSREMLAGETIESRNIREMMDPTWSRAFGYGVTPRQTLQNVGCMFRDHIHPEFWCHTLAQRISSSGSDVVVTDMRFPNEAEFLRKWYGKQSVMVIHVVRPGLSDPPDLHISETSHNQIFADFEVINSGTEAELLAKVNRAVECYFREHE